MQNDIEQKMLRAKWLACGLRGMIEGTEDQKDDAIAEGLLRALKALRTEPTKEIGRNFIWTCIRSGLVDNFKKSGKKKLYDEGKPVRKVSYMDEIGLSDFTRRTGDQAQSEVKQMELSWTPKLEKPLEFGANHYARLHSLVKHMFMLSQAILEKYGHDYLDGGKLMLQEERTHQVGLPSLKGSVITELAYVDPPREWLTYDPRFRKLPRDKTPPAILWHRIPGPEKALLKKERDAMGQTRLYHLIEQAALTDREREALLINLEYPGLSRNDKAQLMGITENTFKKYLGEAKRKLKETGKTSKPLDTFF